MSDHQDLVRCFQCDEFFQQSALVGNICSSCSEQKLRPKNPLFWKALSWGVLILFSLVVVASL